MKKNFTTINDLHNYLVMMIDTGRPGDAYPRIQHAGNVNEIVLALIGAVVWRADNNSIEIGTRMTAEGNLHEANMCWFTVNNKEYALVYRSGKGTVDLCARNRTGNVIASFNNTNHATIQPTFAAL
jgi:hypothetical protein